MHGLRHEFLQGIPDGVYDSIRQLEDSFAIGTPGLKIITARFIEELEKGSVLRRPIFFHPFEIPAEAQIKVFPWREAMSSVPPNPQPSF